MEYLRWLGRIGCTELPFSEEEALKKSTPPLNPPREKLTSINRIVVHHSATETGNAACFRVLHRLVNGWEDVGYHFVIGNGSLSGDGEIETGRKLPLRGAHARGANQDSIGVCLVGNFNDSLPTSLQLHSLGALLRGLMAKYDIAAHSILLHRMVKGSHTECPGKNLSLEKVLQHVEI